MSVCMCVCVPPITFEPIGGFHDTYYARHASEDYLTSTVVNSLSPLFLTRITATVGQEQHYRHLIFEEVKNIFSIAVLLRSCFLEGKIRARRLRKTDM